jgi:protein-S-isoprenylcysteine O-methyltransferase Ste14
VEKDAPGVFAPPPLIFGISFLLGYFGRRWTPLPIIERSTLAIGIAATLMLSSLFIAVSAIVTMFRARTHVDPYEPTTAIVTTGPFRFSRNPLYVSLTLFFAGLSLALGASLSLLLLPLAVAVLQWGVIRREERYLERKFGEPYLDYRKRVRRWF